MTAHDTIHELILIERLVRQARELSTQQTVRNVLDQAILQIASAGNKLGPDVVEEYKNQVDVML